jgi:hypothetical protein
MHGAGVQDPLPGQRNVLDRFVHVSIMEASIAWNSCALRRADAMLTDALNMYFKDTSWHFNKTSRQGKTDHPSSSQLNFQSFVGHWCCTI